jgi:hypothetical protein
MNLTHARLAAHAWDYALSLCIRTLPEGPEREALLAAEERQPSPTSAPCSFSVAAATGRT